MTEDSTWGQWSENLCARCIKELPELENALRQEMESRANSTTGALITFERLLNPYIIDLLRSGNDPGALKNVFRLLESMCGDEDDRVREVAVISVFKRMEWNEEWRELMNPYLGPVSKQAVQDLTQARNLWNSKVNARLIEEFPELEDAYKEELESWDNEMPGPHTIYSIVLNPYIVELLESGGNTEELRKVFDFVEAMCGDEDARIQEVAVVTVLEELEWNPEWLRLMMPCLGPLSEEAVNYLAEFWRGDREAAILGLDSSDGAGDRKDVC